MANARFQLSSQTSGLPTAPLVVVWKVRKLSDPALFGCSTLSSSASWVWGLKGWVWVPLPYQLGRWWYPLLEELGHRKQKQQADQVSAIQYVHMCLVLNRRDRARNSQTLNFCHLNFAAPSSPHRETGWQEMEQTCQRNASFPSY